MEKGTSKDVGLALRMLDDRDERAGVVDVTMDGDDGCVVKAMMIPKNVYDKTYRYDAGSRK